MNITSKIMYMIYDRKRNKVIDNSDFQSKKGVCIWATRHDANKALGNLPRTDSFEEVAKDDYVNEYCIFEVEISANGITHEFK